MKPTVIGLLLLLTVVIAGCVDSAQNAPANGAAGGDAVTQDAAQGTTSDADDGDSERISVRLPGVQIDVDEESGVSVEAPGTSVSVSEEGVDISAPGVEITTTPESESDAADSEAAAEESAAE